MENSYLGEYFSSISTRFQLVFSPKACSRLILAKFHYNPNLFPTDFQLFLSLFPVQFQFDLSSASVRFKLDFRSFPVCSQLVPIQIIVQFQLEFSLAPTFFNSFQFVSSFFSARYPAQFQLVSSSSSP